MTTVEMRARLEELGQKPNRSLSLAEWHEKLQLCEDLGLDRAWQTNKQEMEYWQQRRLQELKASSQKGGSNDSSED